MTSAAPKTIHMGSDGNLVLAELDMHEKIERLSMADGNADMNNTQSYGNEQSYGKGLGNVEQYERGGQNYEPGEGQVHNISREVYDIDPNENGQDDIEESERTMPDLQTQGAGIQSREPGLASHDEGMQMHDDGLNNLNRHEEGLRAPEPYDGLRAPESNYVNRASSEYSNDQQGVIGQVVPQQEYARSREYVGGQNEGFAGQEQPERLLSNNDSKMALGSALNTDPRELKETGPNGDAMSTRTGQTARTGVTNRTGATRPTFGISPHSFVQC